MATAAFILLALSLGFMVFRVFAPRPQQVAGTPVRSIKLSVRERVLLQRKNLYGLGAILILGAVGHWVAFPFELLAIVAAYGVLTVPVRYHLTTEGVALNRVVFRPWREFAGYEVSTRQIVLEGKPGNGRFVLQLLADHQTAVLPLLQRYLPPAAPPAVDGQQTEKGGRRPHSRRRRLQARRS